jgi:D-proline reductase (dithiol) PrdB
MQEEVKMERSEEKVDGYRFLPPGLAAWFRTLIPKEDFKGDIPWAPLTKPLSKTSFALVTSSGISLKSDPPFDMEREKREATWGDPTYREIPKDTTSQLVNVNHLHINTKHILNDLDVILPLARMAELEQEGIIGRLAETSYSFYGFQFQSTAFLDQAIGPMAQRMKKEGVEAVILTPV